MYFASPRPVEIECNYCGNHVYNVEKILLNVWYWKVFVENQLVIHILFNSFLHFVPYVFHNFSYTGFTFNHLTYFLVGVYYSRVVFFSECLPDMLQT